MKKFYWIKPDRSKLYHIAHNGIALCYNWMMTDTNQPVISPHLDPVKGDCKICIKRYNKMIKEAQDA